MDKTNSKLVRPGDPRVPCIAILGRQTSELKLVNLEGGSSSSVKISHHRPLGIVTTDGEVFAVTVKEILKVLSDGTTEHLASLPELDRFSRVVLFQKKIYIIRRWRHRWGIVWRRPSTLCFDPADNSLTDDLPGCGLGPGFCASATDDFIYAMGGADTETQAMKYDPLRRTLEKTAPMREVRYAAAAATLDGKIYVMGGDFALSFTVMNHRTSVEYYNPGNNFWTKGANMNADRTWFSACVVGDRLYAVGGDGEEKNGFCQQSIEVYDKNKWTAVTKFQTKVPQSTSSCSSCFWPHGSHQPGTTQSKDLPGKSYDQLESENLLETKKEEIGYAGRKVFLEGDSDEGKEISMFVEEKEPEDKEAISSTSFKLDEDYFLRTQLWEKALSKPTISSEKAGDKPQSEMFSLKTDGRTATESTGAIARRIPDDEVRELEFRYSSLRLDKKIGPLGGNLFLDKCSFTIRPNAIVDTQNLSISMSMNFKNLALPADRIPVSPYFYVKFRGKLYFPTKARIPTWFSPSEDSEHGIKIYKRYRDKENMITWHELQNEVTVHDGMIEFEADHFCGFLAMIKDRLWRNGQIKLSHVLLQDKRNFQSVFCYHSPKSLFREVVADLKLTGFAEIHRDIFVMNTNREVPIRMECFDVDLHKFEPQRYLLTPSDIKAKHIVPFRFVLQHDKELKDEIDIRYIVDDFSAPIAVTLPATTGPSDTALKFRDGASVTLKNCNFNIQGGDKATSAVGIDLGAQGTVNIKDGNIDVHAGAKGAEK